MNRGNKNVKTAKSTRRPRIQTNTPKKQLLQNYAKQLVTLLALQQAVTRNLQKEIDDS
jgi:hypothetical protein